MKTKSWYARGKLLLTGEYLVLEGAKALALPLKKGQYLSVKKQKEKKLSWNALKPDGLWFQAIMQLPKLNILQSTDEALAKKLHSILKKTQSLNPDFLWGTEGLTVETILEFDPQYGFGSSSTFIFNLARWADVDPYLLQKVTFGGSGYDIACASAKKPVIYHLEDGKPVAEQFDLNFGFTGRIYFIYLGHKQLSAESIKTFRKKSKFSRQDLEEASKIAADMLKCRSLAVFEGLVKTHEKLLSRILKRPQVGSLVFPDHLGVVKSLGGWGGDFVLMTSHMEHPDFVEYLGRKGFGTWYRYDEIVL